MKPTGKKMSAAESFAFKGAERQMKRGINEDGVVTSKKMKKMFAAGWDRLSCRRICARIFSRPDRCIDRLPDQRRLQKKPC